VRENFPLRLGRRPAGRLSARRGGVSVLQVLRAGDCRRDLADDRGDDAAETAGHGDDEHDRDEGQDEAVLDGRLPLLIADELSQEALEVIGKHVVFHPLAVHIDFSYLAGSSSPAPPRCQIRAHYPARWPCCRRRAMPEAPAKV